MRTWASNWVVVCVNMKISRKNTTPSSIFIVESCGWLRGMNNLELKLVAFLFLCPQLRTHAHAHNI
jgi:hypothetical protein